MGEGSFMLGAHSLFVLLIYSQGGGDWLTPAMQDGVTTKLLADIIRPLRNLSSVYLPSA